MKVTAAILALWIGYEGFAPKPEIPTKGDVPTIGHGSTHYGNGVQVKMTDPPITRQRAAELANTLLEDTYASCVRRYLGDTPVNITEWEVAVDFAGQYGCGNYLSSSMLRQTKAGQYAQACKSYLMWKKAAGYDCSQWVNGAPNKRCYGVWTRQQDRSNACTAAL